MLVKAEQSKHRVVTLGRRRKVLCEQASIRYNVVRMLKRILIPQILSTRTSTLEVCTRVNFLCFVPLQNIRPGVKANAGRSTVSWRMWRKNNWIFILRFGLIFGIIFIYFSTFYEAMRSDVCMTLNGIIRLEGLN